MSKNSSNIAQAVLPSQQVTAVSSPLHVKKLTAKLIFVEGPLQGQEFILQQEQAVLGRSEFADVFIDDHKLSREHIRLFKTENGYSVVDLNSSNGSFVNGNKVTEYVLKNLDVIAIGKNKIKFIMQDVLVNPLASNATQSNPPASPETSDPESDIVSSPMEEQEGYLKKVATWLFATGAVGLLVFALYQKFSPYFQPKQIAAPLVKPIPVAAKKETPKVISKVPAKFDRLSAQERRRVISHYEFAVWAEEHQGFEEAIWHLARVHQLVPFYMNSQELLKASMENVPADRDNFIRTDSRHLTFQMAIEQLKTGQLKNASEKFIKIIKESPRHTLAFAGLRKLNAFLTEGRKFFVSLETDAERRMLGMQAFDQATYALRKENYDLFLSHTGALAQMGKSTASVGQALDMAKNQLNATKQFGSLVNRAENALKLGQYMTARQMGEEILRQDPSFFPAIEIVLQAKAKLERLGRKMFAYAYLLESMGNDAGARDFWQMIPGRSGDKYFDRARKKLSKQTPPQS